MNVCTVPPAGNPAGGTVRFPSVLCGVVTAFSAIVGRLSVRSLAVEQGRHAGSPLQQVTGGGLNSGLLDGDSGNEPAEDLPRRTGYKLRIPLPVCSHRLTSARSEFDLVG